jgi:predicted transcriptional regulator YdeE
MPDPVAVDHPPFTVLGVRARTTNAAEADPATARIPALWGAYLGAGGAAGIPGADPAAATFSVYTAYDSDHRGAYDVVVGAAVRDDTSGDGTLARVTVPGGRYLVFTETGAMPGAVIAAWQRVWRHFEAHVSVRRAYTADFELHDPRRPDTVAVYVAVDRSP